MLECFGKRPVVADSLAGVDQRLVYGMVARGVEGDHLLDVYRLLLLDLEGEHLVDIVLHLVEVALHGERSFLAVHAGSGRLGNVDPRLAGPDLQGDDLGPERPR
jgi:hypothetical protein